MNDSVINANVLVKEQISGSLDKKYLYYNSIFSAELAELHRRRPPEK